MFGMSEKLQIKSRLVLVLVFESKGLSLGNKTSLHSCSISSLRKQSTFRDSMTGFCSLRNDLWETSAKVPYCWHWFAPVIEGLYFMLKISPLTDFRVHDRTWNLFALVVEVVVVNWKIKLILQRRLLHMSISVEATGKYYTYNLCSICG